jgi:hypothetical protein
MTPEEKAKHPDAIVLDVGHPLIRRLIAIVREHTFQDTKEGARTAAYHVKGATKSMLIGQGLLRATAKTNPPTLLEEIVVFGIAAGVDGEHQVDRAEVVSMMELEPSPQIVNREEALADLKLLFQNQIFQQTREEAKDAAKQELLSYRNDRLAELSEVSEDKSWLTGFNDIEEVGFDLHTLTLIMPEAR